jgi:uncharacterized membrane protein YoaK (UPF0700 family)
MLALHQKKDVLSLRHLVSWVMLAAAAGAVNTGAFMACERFVAHVTGTVMRLGLEEQTTLLIDYGLLLLCFVLGAMASVLAIDRRYYRGMRPLHEVPLVVVAVLLVVVSLLGVRGVFGAFGGEGQSADTWVFLSLLAFAMGLQNAAVATSTGTLVRTTHLTGPTTDLGVQLASAMCVQGEARRSALQGAGLRAGKIIGFMAGVMVAVPLASRVGYSLFLLPAALVLVATLISFLPSLSPSEEVNRQDAKV